MYLSPKIQEVINSYQKHIEENYEEQYLKSFNDLLNKGNEEAAISEAVVFNWLSQNELNPRINEDKSVGGADFICTYRKEYQFVVEVTSLGSEELAEATGCQMIPGQSTFYQLPTKMIRQRVSAKAPQLADYEIPRILVITTLNISGSLLLGIKGAESFFTSDITVAIPIGKSSSDYHLSTDLKESIFFRWSKKEPKVEFWRTSISAVMLFPISHDRLSVTGILHPEPEYPLNMNVFSGIPFLTMDKESLKKGEIHTEWKVADPNPASFDIYSKINN